MLGFFVTKTVDPNGSFLYNNGIVINKERKNG